MNQPPSHHPDTNPRVGTLTTDIGDAHFASLGRLTVQFALLEHGLARLIHAMLGADSVRATIVTADLPFKGRASVAAALYRQRILGSPNRVERMAKIIGAACKAEADRNTLIHSTWMAAGRGEDPYRTKISARNNRLVIHDVQVPAAEIEAVTARLAALTFDVLTLEQEFI